MTYETHSDSETRDVARGLAANAKPGEVYALIGDLGVGKTVFTQGFSEGLGIEDIVNSPTFTIVQEYVDGRLPLYHFDVYRIGDVDEMLDVGFDDYIFGDGVSLIEWADMIEDLLPPETTYVTIGKDVTQGYDYRRIEIS